MAALTPLLCLIGAVGHAALLFAAINRMYGTRFRGWWVSGLRWLGKGAIVLGPPAFLYYWGADLWQTGRWQDLPPAVLAWLALCWLVGFPALAWATWGRWTRRPPAVCAGFQVQVMDVAHDLGRPPRGSGRRQWMARLPGNEIFRVAFTELELRLPRLPAAWDGLTLWHLTDLHLCGLPDLPFYEAVLDRCAAAPADLVVFTGDLVDSDGHYNWITPLLARLRWREAALAILGNHDGWHDVPRITKAVEAAGFALIGGGWRRLTIRGEPLTVIGNEMPWLRPLPDLRDCPAEGLRLCLSHSPDQLPWARRHGIDLMLAGHNHGGQIRVPGFGPILCPSQYGRRYDGGLYHEPPTVLYVSRGLSGTYPLRYFCPPEVTRITLRRG